jgi:hypothetical protein
VNFKTLFDASLEDSAPSKAVQRVLAIGVHESVQPSDAVADGGDLKSRTLQ